MEAEASVDAEAATGVVAFENVVVEDVDDSIIDLSGFDDDEDED